MRANQSVPGELVTGKKDGRATRTETGGGGITGDGGTTGPGDEVPGEAVGGAVGMAVRLTEKYDTVNQHTGCNSDEQVEIYFGSKQWFGL